MNFVGSFRGDRPPRHGERDLRFAGSKSLTCTATSRGQARFSGPVTTRTSYNQFYVTQNYRQAPLSRYAAILTLPLKWRVKNAAFLAA